MEQVRDHLNQPATLKLLQGPGAPLDYPLENDNLVIGRSAEVDIRIASSDISRKHMLLKRNGEEFSFVDLDSRNGIYLNNVKVHSAVLRNGDYLQLGNVVFCYLEGS